MSEYRAQASFSEAGEDLLNSFSGRFGTILADPPWRFSNRTGKMAPEHRRLNRYSTMSHEQIVELPVRHLARDCSHLYLSTRSAQ